MMWRGVEIIDEQLLTPPLKWAGGKRWLVPELKPLWEPFQDYRLVEPFCGGLAVSLALRPKRALLNDLNPHLLNFYKWIQQGLVVSLDLKNDKDFYYEARTRFNALNKDSSTANNQETAELFYYLNRTGYNGLCRFNRRGEFNVPFGRYKTINYAKDFLEYQEVLKGWEFRSGDFEELSLNGDDFVYADPPYDVEFTQYASEDFRWEDQVRLGQWLVKHDGPVIISNQATNRIVELYSDLNFEMSFLDAPRRISCTGDRTPAKEVLAWKGLGLAHRRR